MSTLRQALEDALLADPDDRAAHMAYADHLAEQGDPRGEFIQVQIVLEGPELPSERYRELRRREAELLARHEQEWLGELAIDLLDRWAGRYRIVRGWLDSLEVPVLSADFARRLRNLPLARLLRRLVLIQTQERSQGIVEGFRADLSPLGGAPFLSALRVFQFGPDPGLVWWADPVPDLHSFHVAGGLVLDLVEQMTRLEELALRNIPVDLTRLLRLPLTHLRALRLGAPGTDDAGVREIVRSGLLGRLRALELTGGAITDSGARALAGCPHLARLRQLHLEGNRLTPAGVRALNLAGVADLRVGQQFPSGPG